MATATNARNSLRKNATTQMTNKSNGGMRAIIQKMKPEIENALRGTALDPERFTRLVLSTISSSPQLASCTPESFCAAMMSAAQLGLEPNTPLGQAYLIPYGKQCQFQIGYQGMINLAYRSGQIKKIDAQAVYENDEFDYQLGWDATLYHKPAMKDRGEVIGYYALFKLESGGGNFLFMSYEDVLKHAQKFSKTFKNGPWQTDFDAMAKKTVIKQLLKYAPIAVELQRAINSDETIKEVDIDNLNEVDVLDVQAEYEIDDDFVPFPVDDEKKETSTDGQESVFK